MPIPTLVDDVALKILVGLVANPTLLVSDEEGNAQFNIERESAELEPSSRLVDLAYEIAKEYIYTIELEAQIREDEQKAAD